MEKYTYLLVNFFSIIVCFIYSFHHKIRFDRYFGAFLKASILVTIPYIIWDAYFTKIGVWWFNDRYLIGPRFLGLPLEEWLFFICVPFACTFSYFCLNTFFKLKFSDKYFFALSALACFIIAFLNTDLIYPFVTFLVTGLTLVYLRFIEKVDWLAEVSIAYTVLLVPFFIVNGILTGTGLEEPIVNYNSDHFWNIRILTVPIEDAVYGYTLITWNIYFFKKFSGWRS
jgi:lycopene cyclase domain-containing protein